MSVVVVKIESAVVNSPVAEPETEIDSTEKVRPSCPPEKFATVRLRGRFKVGNIVTSAEAFAVTEVPGFIEKRLHKSLEYIRTTGEVCVGNAVVPATASATRTFANPKSNSFTPVSALAIVSTIAAVVGSVHAATILVVDGGLSVAFAFVSFFLA